MDEKVVAAATLKALRDADKAPPGADPGLVWAMWVDADDATVLVVLAGLRPDVKADLLAQRKAARPWARGTVRKGAAGLLFHLEDGQKLNAKEATRRLKAQPPEALGSVKTLLKSVEVVDAAAAQPAADAQTGDVQAADGDAARCDAARERAKEAFLAVKELATPALLEHLVALRDVATQARKDGKLGEATEGYLDLVARARAVRAALRVDPSALAATWSQAEDRAAAQVGALAAALRKSGDRELAAIADRGLPGLHRDLATRLRAALERAAAAQEVARVDALGAVAEVATEFGVHLDADEAVAAVDDNPFGVNVSLRGTLRPALDALAAAAG